jgi:23S rRNA (guanosine2251-2'-O)-methyltransferase
MARPGQRGEKPRRRTRDDHQPRFDLEGEVLYGRNAVIEALAGRRVLHRLFAAEGIREDERVRAILSAASSAEIPIDRIDRESLDFISNTTRHQGVALVVGDYPYAPLDEILVLGTGTVLILDHLQDPQNLGTLLRTAEATGVVGILLPHDRAVAVTPSVVNSSSGAVEHQRVCRVTNLAHSLELLKRSGWWVAALEGSPESEDLFTSTIPEPIAIVVGSEGGGVSLGLKKHCDLLLSIPMVGRVASLNAATAGSIALYELLRRSKSNIV